MAQLLLVALVVIASVVVAQVIARRKPDAPASGVGRVPTQIDRADFDSDPSGLLLIVFTSATCAGCAEIWRHSQSLARRGLSVEEVEVGVKPEVHQRYQIDAVPLTVFADEEGVVLESFLGPVAKSTLSSTAEALL